MVSVSSSSSSTFIIGLVKVINQELVVAINGPIMFFIPKENVDNNVWDIPDGYMNKLSSKKLIVGDYIKIQIVDKRINQNDNQIKAIGRLVDFATTEDVEIYFGSKVVSEKSIDNTSSAIESVNTEEPDTESNYII